MSLQRDISKLRGIIAGLEDEAAKIIQDNAELILELLKKGQLDKGLTSDGRIAGYYSPVTDAIASSAITLAVGRPRQDKVAGQPYNFDWTGKWRDSMFVKTLRSEKGFDILSSDTKTAMLEDFVGARLTKLTEEHNDFINEHILLPQLLERSFERFFN